MRDAGQHLVAQAPGALAALAQGLASSAEWRSVGGGTEQRASAERRSLAILLDLVELALAEPRGTVSSSRPDRGQAAPLAALVDRLLARKPREPPSLEPRFDGGRSLSERAPALGALVSNLDDAQLLAILRPLLCVDGERVDFERVDEEHLGRVYETLLETRIAGDDAELAMRSRGGRRHTGSHYTPRELTGPIVARSLEPLLAAMGPEPPSERILELRICDPAMGGGAFLLESCRALADALLAAWAREGRHRDLAQRPRELRRLARREVARGCLYGVDRDQDAVDVARRSLALVVGDPAPGAFLADRLRHGDALVGLSVEQIRAFHWRPAGSGSLLLDRCLRGGAPADRERLRLVGDLLVGAFFAADRPVAREQERRRRLALVERWLGGDGQLEAELCQLRRQVRAEHPVFHWPLEFHEVFLGGRPDPIAGAGVQRTGMDAFVGNPPFLGGKRISTEHGARFADWLGMLHGSSKNTDLAAHFLRRADTLLGGRGVIGFIATNTLSEGDTRRDGLRYLVAESDHVIYDAVKSMPWPGDAAVHIAVVHTAKGALVRPAGLTRRLDGRPVAAVDSMLRAAEVGGEARVLGESRGICFIGCFLRGRGFVLDEAEACALGAKPAPADGEPLRPFLGGAEVNRSPQQDFSRYVIDFADWPLERAATHAALLEIVAERVRPARSALADRGVDRSHRLRWWQFANPRPELRAALAPLTRCLVAARVTKHLCFSFQPTDRTFSDQLCVFALDGHGHFAMLQSRLHERWARLHSSTFGVGLRYTPSDCVETFPFPRRDPRAVTPALEAAGEQLYRRRAEHMVERGEGLTATYNRLLDPACELPVVLELRALHEAIDRAMLDAYGWHELEVPPYCPATSDERAAVQNFGATVTDRLRRLNAARAG